ncbi:MAG: tetratricopeptide repeat protein [Ignavibacteriae bacterium]|nr:tetratricopeptide repeat protein [Ignavibacteriota bacterium]NOG99473.1 tetratricopeptide repeat protein [Ignavibacteriota bacterium]
MKNFIAEIKERKLRKWLAIYVSTAVTTIGVVHLLSIRFQFPNYIFDIVFFTLLFGLGTGFIISWYHGKEGKQKIKKLEIVLHAFIIAALGVVLFYRVGSDTKVKGDLEKNIVAVLPFTNFNDNKENEFFADGITDDILTQLSKISDLKVISRTSVMKYKNTDLNISEISQELGAGTILEGSVRTYGDKIRIVGQLIDAKNDVHIWSQTYDRELEDVFKIQSEIAERIAAALQANLLPMEKELIKNKNTDNIEAYTFFLKGKDHYYNYTKEENEKAITFFKKALEVDSNYALALAGLADAYGQKVKKYWESEEWHDSSLVLSKKALRINPNLPEAYKALASSYDGLGETELALANYKKAIELNPNYWSAILNYGQIKMFAGNYDEAFYWIRRAHTLAPDDVMGNLSVSLIYKYLNCDSLAIIWAERALSLEPQHTYALSYIGDVYLNNLQIDKAENYFNKSIAVDSNWIYGWYFGGRLQAVAGNYKKSKERFDKYLKISGSPPEYFYAHTLLALGENDSAASILKQEAEDYLSYFDGEPNFSNFDYIAFAEINAILNKTDLAFKWWNEAIKNSYTDIKRIKVYPYFDNIKSDPRYNNYLKAMHAKVDSFKTIIKDDYQEYAICD